MGVCAVENSMLFILAIISASHKSQVGEEVGFHVAVSKQRICTHLCYSCATHLCYRDYRVTELQISHESKCATARLRM
jgi:hypothetical protein